MSKGTLKFKFGEVFEPKRTGLVKEEQGTRTDYEPRSKKLQTVAGTVLGSPENCSIHEKCMKMKTFGFLLETPMNFTRGASISVTSP